ncbi:MAG: regulatory protein RecX [Gemmatimonadetes bacterium]|nr:regulatory protein RecX [Gemmatimonadota bacterium]
MPRITALTAHPRRAGRYTLSVDGAVLEFGGNSTAEDAEDAEDRHIAGTAPRFSHRRSPKRLPLPSSASSASSAVDSQFKSPAKPLLLDAALIHALSLKVGLELTADLIRSIEAGANVVAAMDQALSMLARRAHSRRELERGLSQKGLPKPAIDAVVTRLVERALLDDRAYAESFARSRLIGRGQSRRRVAAELAKRGVARADADEALARVAAEDGVDELDQARRAAQKKMRGLRSLEPDVARRRLMGYLLRQGFGGEAVRRVTAELLPR